MKHNIEILYAEAILAVADKGSASTSLLQRRLRLSYAVAYELLELLTERGVIGEMDGAKPRKILFSV